VGVDRQLTDRVGPPTQVYTSGVGFEEAVTAATTD